MHTRKYSRHRFCIYIGLTISISMIIYCILGNHPIIHSLHRTFFLQSFPEEESPWNYLLSAPRWPNQSFNNNLPWYFSNGTIRPTLGTSSQLNLWPEDDSSDRIVSQLMWIDNQFSVETKKIYLVPSANMTFIPFGQKPFLDHRCPVNRCEITQSRETADVVIFNNRVSLPRTDVSQEQIWILYLLENPLYYSDAFFNHAINWTATYRSDSDIVYPYDKWIYYDENVKQLNQSKNYATGRRGRVAWFVSNCNPRNNRLEYALQLQMFYPVDIYGRCGTRTCPRSNEEECYKMLNEEYKFYLAFENGNCREYITEKFFRNALQHDVLPIVMGAHPDDYKTVAPMNSYIHVEDFETPSALAAYLRILDTNDDLYNSYFRWKGTGEFINTRFFCRVCAAIHTPRKYQPERTAALGTWWSNKDVCRNGTWT